jgi:hypothetical protein
VPEPPGAPIPPFHDVNGDGNVDIADIIAVISFLRSGAAGESGGESGGSGGGGSGGGGSGEGGSGEGEPASLQGPRGIETFLLESAESRRIAATPRELPLLQPVLSPLLPLARQTLDLHADHDPREKTASRFAESQTPLSTDVLPQLAAQAFGGLDWRAVDRVLGQPERAWSRDEPTQRAPAASNTSGIESPSKSQDSGGKDSGSTGEDHRLGSRRWREAHDEVFGELERRRDRRRTVDDQDAESQDDAKATQPLDELQLADQQPE